MNGAAPIRLSSRQLAMVSEISDRAAKLAVKACVGGGTWRGVRLVAVQSPGRGGKSGQRYLLEVDSLPAELQQRAFELFPELAVAPAGRSAGPGKRGKDRKPRVLVGRAWDGGIRSEEKTSELKSLMLNSYAVLCLKKKKTDTDTLA